MVNDKKDQMDKRCRKTRKAIKLALIKIMSEKELSDITITEIAGDADINRKTFYFHYRDLYDVLDEIENDLVCKIFQILDRADLLKSIHNPYPLFHQITSEINEDTEFYSLLVQSKDYNNLMDKIKAILKERFLEMCIDTVQMEKEILSFTIDFITSGLTSVYREWVHSDQSISLEQLTKSLSILIGSGFNALAAEQKQEVMKE
jgi:AcrR family transcriptional regulator